jgi:DNA repair photolyase
MRPPIYPPKGAAKEYADWALNIYDGCPHACPYCYVPAILRKDRAEFHKCAKPREGLLDALSRQLELGLEIDHRYWYGKLIHLCFTCDPYPTGCDSSITRTVIKMLHEAGAFCQILTKGDPRLDFDLLTADDWVGVTVDGGWDYSVTPGGADRAKILVDAKRAGIRTFISAEPLLNFERLQSFLEHLHCWEDATPMPTPPIDQIRLGPLNHVAGVAPLNWRYIRDHIHDRLDESVKVVWKSGALKLMKGEK